eukprot:scaffold122904_cov62-Attheya_sp.AAC.1
MSSVLREQRELQEEMRNRQELKYPEDQKMLLAIKSLIESIKTNEINDLQNKQKKKSGKEKKINAPCIQSDTHDHAKEINEIIRLREGGSSINSACILHRAIGLRCNTTVVSLLLKMGADVNQKDQYNCTPLHVAAGLNSSLVPFLVRNGAKAGVPNANGEIEIAILEAKWKDFISIFREDRIFITSVYTNAHLEEVNALLPPDQKNLLVDGWMSPRMEHTLLHYAEIGGDTISDGCANLSYIPTSFKQLMGTRGFLDGYAECLRGAASLLRRGRTPTVERIENVLPCSARRNYIEKGGKIEYALDFMMKSIIYDDDPMYLEDDDFQDLPQTPLDEAVEIAKVMCIDLGGGELDEDGGGPYASCYQDDDNYDFDQDDYY